MMKNCRIVLLIVLSCMMAPAVMSQPAPESGQLSSDSEHSDRNWLRSLYFSGDKEARTLSILKRPGTWHLDMQIECDSCDRPVAFWHLGDVPIYIDGVAIEHKLDFLPGGILLRSANFWFQEEIDDSYDAEKPRDCYTYRWEYDHASRKIRIYYLSDESARELKEEYVVWAIGWKTMVLGKNWDKPRRYLNIYGRD